MQKPVHARITEKVGHEVNVKSPPQMFELLYKEMKFPPYKIAPTSEDALVKLIGNHCKGKDGPEKIAILTDVLEERRIRDQKSRYINFCPDYDDRCKTSFNIIATETCRSSTSILKKPVRPKKIGLAFHTISKHGRLAKDIRSMFIPDEGKVFLQADSSQAEARVVAVLMRDFELLKAFDTIDIHRRTAALILGMTSFLDLAEGQHASDVIGKDSSERFCGKKVRHAGNYDMKKARFMQEFNTDANKFEIDISISEWKAGVMLEQFHAASPKIKNVFHADIRAAIDGTRTLIDPYGGVRIFNGRMDESLYQEAYANIPQRTVGHLVQGAALKVNDELGDEVGSVHSNRPVNWISENHDSLLMQVPANNWEPYARLLKKHMTTPISFKLCTLSRDYELIIPCDVELGEKNYAEMQKVKL
jgi:DNA polymerase-1